MELLVEQIEAADAVILNKTDLTSEKDLAVTRELVGALNSKALIRDTSYGKIELDAITSEASDEE